MPASFVLAAVSVPRSTLGRTTSQLGTIPPPSSVTKPEIVAVSVCPIATYATHNSPSKQPQTNRTKCAIFMVVKSPLNTVCPRSGENSPLFDHFHGGVMQMYFPALVLSIILTAERDPFSS